MTRPCVAVFLRGYLPGYRSGGPLQSIANLVSRLGDEFDFRIITADHDLGNTRPYADTPLMRWVPVGKAHAMYLPPREQWLSTIARSEEHKSELQSLMRISYAVFCLQKKTSINNH